MAHKLFPTAEDMYIKEGKTLKEIHEKTGVSMTSLSRWNGEHKWKSRRSAYVNSSKQRVENIKEIISNITEQQLEVFKELKKAGDNRELKTELNSELVKLSDQVSKWTKALEKLETENKVSLSTYLEVMDDIFKHLNLHDPKLFAKTIEFQQEHLYTIANKLG